MGAILNANIETNKLDIFQSLADAWFWINRKFKNKKKILGFKKYKFVWNLSKQNFGNMSIIKIIFTVPRLKSNNFFTYFIIN